MPPPGLAAILRFPMPAFDPQTIVLATLAMSLVLFVTDALRYDAVAILVVLVLTSTGCLDAEAAFAGFALHYDRPLRRLVEGTH